MAKRLLRVDAFTPVEGADWLPWPMREGVNPPNGPTGRATLIVQQGRVNLHVHSLRFSDGREWDTKNGWRLK